jgi:uncharacterized membrane protein YdcZ (DUF606 family)
VNAARRWVANAAWILAGIVLYAVCIDVFGGYPRFATEFWSWVALAAIVAAGVVVWVRHERRGDR